MAEALHIHVYCQPRRFINMALPGRFPKRFDYGKFYDFIFTLILSVEEFHQHSASLVVS